MNAARKRLAALQETTTGFDGPLIDFTARVSPELDRFDHLEPIAAALDRARTEPIRLCFSVPPQHGKSTLVFHAIAREARRRKVLYLTYNDDFAASQMRIARRIAQRAGLQFARGSVAMCEWSLETGGALFAGGISGGVTGRPGEVIIVDDPHKNWAEAQSATIRERIDHDFKTAIMTRAHPQTPVIIVQTRWHVDDMIGRRVDEGWEYINLPAIDDDGKALWPARRPRDFLEKQRASEGLGDLLFSALYQGRPVPVGGELFPAPALCLSADVPVYGRRAIGVDLAYTRSTQSDFSVRIDLVEADDRYFVANVERRQVRAPEFARTLVLAASEFPGCPIWWHAGGVEIGSADFIRELGAPIHIEPATTDKFVRAQRAAALWRDGRIVVPSDAPWSQTFIREVMQFTGRGDAHDDQVDAMVSAVAALEQRTTGEVMTSRPRSSRGFRSAY